MVIGVTRKAWFRFLKTWSTWISVIFVKKWGPIFSFIFWPKNDQNWIYYCFHLKAQLFSFLLTPSDPKSLGQFLRNCQKTKPNFTKSVCFPFLQNVLFIWKSPTFSEKSPISNSTTFFQIKTALFWWLQCTWLIK